MTEKPKGCVAPAQGPLLPPVAETAPARSDQQEVARMQVMVGKPAPDFEASAYVDGDFRNIKLSDYRGKWVTLCFYPGDFTFV